MPSVFHLTALADPTRLAPGQMLSLPLIPKTEPRRFRIRDITCFAVGSGKWPAHTEAQPELYVILSGRVIYDTGSERLDLGPGDAVLFDIGDRHATDIPEGILSLAINLIEIDREG